MMKKKIDQLQFVKYWLIMSGVTLFGMFFAIWLLNSQIDKSAVLFDWLFISATYIPLFAWFHTYRCKNDSKLPTKQIDENSHFKLEVDEIVKQIIATSNCLEKEWKELKKTKGEDYSYHTFLKEVHNITIY